MYNNMTVFNSTLNNMFMINTLSLFLVMGVVIISIWFGCTMYQINLHDKPPIRSTSSKEHKISNTAKEFKITKLYDENESDD